MRMKQLFYALGVGCTLCACSSTDEPQGPNEQDFTKSNKYVSVSIVTTAGNTRAGEYEDGDDSKEYDVNGVGFYFFNRQGECVDAEYFTSTEFKKPTEEDEADPDVTSIGTIEIELSGNRVYDSVIAVINPNSALMSSGKLVSKSKGELLDYYANYAGVKKATVNDVEKGNFTMSNSTYINDNSYNGEKNFTPHVAVAIGSENIYTKSKPESEMDDAEKTALANTRKQKAINIYVERVCSKIYVDNQPSFSGYYVTKDETSGVESKEISVMENQNGNSVETKIVIVPEFLGIGLSVTSKNAYLLKYLDNEALSYRFSDNITNFTWNDFSYKRSYWESTPGLATTTRGGFNYTKWNDLKNAWAANAAADYIEYINPNTSAPTDYDANTNEATKTTKLLVRAKLKYRLATEPSNTPARDLDLVMFGGSYWMAEYLLFHAANQVVKHLDHIEDFLPSTVLEEEVSKVKAAIANIVAKEKNAELEEGQINLTEKLSLVRLTTGSENAYLAQLNIKDGEGNYPDLLGSLDDNIKDKVTNIVNAQIQSTLNEITNRQIQYWKDGMTYFYMPIRHQGFSGLEGSNNKYLNGVVRNHVYKVAVGKIYGLGTPVIDPEEPIDPERPDNAPKSYMTAKINVLKWRVVSSTVNMH